MAPFPQGLTNVDRRWNVGRIARRSATALLVLVLLLALMLLAAWAGATAWLGGDYQRDLAEQRARVAQGSRLVSTRCGPVEVAEMGMALGAGQAATPPLLVVHGSGGGFDQGLRLGADFAPPGTRVIAPSRFGYLRTPWPGLAEGEAEAKGQAKAEAKGETAAAGRPAPNIGEVQADHLACVLDALGVAQVAVMGVSAGAIAATEFAVRHPQRTKALILIVPAGYRPAEGAGAAAPMPAWGQWLLESVIAADAPFWLVSRVAPDVVRRFVLATPPAQYAVASEADRQRVDRTMREILPISARLRGLVHDTVATQRVPRPAFESIRAPTLAVSARDDGFGTLASATHAAQQIPGARLVAFEKGGHLLLGHEAEVKAAVADLLRRAADAEP